MEDLFSYKGQFFNNEKEIYSDPISGAHFDYQILYQKLKKVRDQLHKKSKNEINNLIKKYKTEEFCENESDQITLPSIKNKSNKKIICLNTIKNKNIPS